MILKSSISFIEEFFSLTLNQLRKIYLKSNIYDKKISTIEQHSLSYKPSLSILNCIIKYEKKTKIEDYYVDAIAELDRFIRVYPKHDSLDYAYYLLAICYYEQIVDEKKDLQSIVKAKDNFKIVINKFPITEYASDSKFKIDLINDVLASKEMYIGRYYLDKKKWIPAINRFRTVVDDYQTTIYTEEALHRLVEIYYILGLKDESKKYANLLGYNYQSSRWYEKSYSVFNKKYKNRKINSEKKSKGNTIINKMISLF